MKKPAKSKSKVTKSVVKKSAPKRKAVVKKAVVTKKRPTIARKVTSKKKSFKLKKLGVFAMISGALAAVVLAIIAFSGTVPSEAASTSDTSVLGWFSNFTSTKFAAPKGLVAQAVDSYVVLTWKSVPKATTYNIYRSTSWIGGMKKIASGTFSDLTYTDNLTTPSKKYRYAVSAFDGFRESGKSSVKSVTSAKLPTIKAPDFTLSNPMDDGYSIIMSVASMSKLADDEGFNIYCDYCVDKKVRVSNMYGISSAKVMQSGIRDYQIKGLDVNKKYTFQLTRFIRTAAGKTYESAKSAKKFIITPAVSSRPVEPTGFEYHGSIIGGGLAFIWDIPASAADGYIMSINCKSGNNSGGWNGYPVPFTLHTYSKPVPVYGFDLEEFGSGRGICTAMLSAYYLVDGIKNASTFASATFDNGAAGTPMAPIGFKLGGLMGGGGAFFTWNTPAVAVSGYNMMINCSDDGYRWSKDIDVAATWKNSEGQTVYDTGNSFTDGHGSCTAFLSSYITYPDIGKLSSEFASAADVFNN